MSQGFITVTAHAHQRAVERMGWDGTPEDLEIFLLSFLSVRVGLEMALTGARCQWAARVPKEGIVAIFSGVALVTVVRSSGFIVLKSPAPEMAGGGA